MVHLGQEEVLAKILCQEGERVIRTAGPLGVTVRVLISDNVDELVAFVNRLYRPRMRRTWTTITVHRLSF